MFVEDRTLINKNVDYRAESGEAFYRDGVAWFSAPFIKDVEVSDTAS
jgi:hypothetical protein